MMNKLKEKIEEYNSTKKELDALYAERTALVKKTEEMSQAKDVLKRKIGDLFWGSLKKGDILTDGTQEVEIYLKMGKATYPMVYLKDDVDLDGRRDAFFKDWLHPIDGYATRAGWHKKDDESDSNTLSKGAGSTQD